MSLLRTGLVLGTIIYLMPTDTEKQKALITSASDTLVWGLTYCQREPETCQQAQAVWQEMTAKAKFGVALASDLARKWSEQRGEPGSAKHATPARLPAGSVVPDAAAEPTTIDQLVGTDPSIDG